MRKKIMNMAKVVFDKSTMPDFKKEHSIDVAETAKLIAEQMGLDGDRAYVYGILHDIGCNFDKGIQHPYNGYKYLKELGFPKNICLCCIKHSFIEGHPNCTAEGLIIDGNGKVLENCLIPYDNQEQTDEFLRLLDSPYSDYDKIINLCDLMCTTKYIGLDSRLKDLKDRKGIHPTTENHEKKAYELKKYIEKKMGAKIEDLMSEFV